MTFSCRYFADGSQYGQNDFAKFMDDGIEDGYVTGVGNELRCSCDGSDMRVAVATGRGYMHGYSFDVSDLPYYVTMPTADPTYDRIDRVVARLSPDTNKNIILTYVQGTPASAPVAPALTRTDATWEISLAQVRIPAGSSYIPSGNVTDERNNFTVCGIANGIDGSKVTHGTVPYQRLPPATASTIGAIKPGYGLRVETDGTLIATVSDLSGYFAAEIPSNRPGIKLEAGFGFTATNNDATTISSGTGNITFNGAMSFAADARYIPKVAATPITFNVKVTAYMTKWDKSMATTHDEYLNNATIYVKRNGVIIAEQVIGAKSSRTFNISVTSTPQNMLSGTWTITGTGYINPSSVYGVASANAGALAQNTTIQYFVIE